MSDRHQLTNNFNRKILRILRSHQCNSLRNINGHIEVYWQYDMRGQMYCHSFHSKPNIDEMY